MASSLVLLTLYLLELNPALTTNSPGFNNLHLDNAQREALARVIIESRTFVGQTRLVYASTGSTSSTAPVSPANDALIKRYLNAFINVDSSALRICFPGFNAAAAKRTVVDEIINRRGDLYTLYLEYKRDLIERTRAVTALPSTAPRAANTQSRLRSVPTRVRDRDGGVCRVSGIGCTNYWHDRQAEATAANAGCGTFLPCEVAHAIPWNVNQPYWDLVRRLFGVSGSATNTSSPGVDIPENAILLLSTIHKWFQDFSVYLDAGFVFRRRPEASNIDVSELGISHVRHGYRAFDGGFLNIAIRPPTSTAIPDVQYFFFLLHKLIGDIVYMAGGAETLGLDDFGPDEDPWTPTLVVSSLSSHIPDQNWPLAGGPTLVDCPF